MTASNFDPRRFHTRAILQELVPPSEHLSLTARALEGMLVELSVSDLGEASENQAALVRSAALDIVTIAIQIVGGAEKLLLLAKLDGSGE